MEFLKSPCCGRRAAVIEQIIDLAVIGHDFFDLFMSSDDKFFPAFLICGSGTVSGIGPVGNGIIESDTQSIFATCFHIFFQQFIADEITFVMTCCEDGIFHTAAHGEFDPFFCTTFFRFESGESLRKIFFRRHAFMKESPFAAPESGIGSIMNKQSVCPFKEFVFFFRQCHNITPVIFYSMM